MSRDHSRLDRRSEIGAILNSLSSLKEEESRRTESEGCYSGSGEEGRTEGQGFAVEFEGGRE